MRIVRILLLVLLAFSALFFGALIRSRTWGKRFVALHPGDTRATVLQRAGQPSRTMQCAALPEPPDGCQTVLVYSGPLSTIIPEFWLTPLDANDRVLRVLHTTRAD
ncbi:hypothetical protein [Terriglobus aquaticus]|uniref:Uncharacterized protein n=1 Tax=Terriglobus aquaticus TaxID=940139 RepID=A0ABW9KNE8_9BACT|nr:hypothetical protein [Terriglobus aquaticus]